MFLPQGGGFRESTNRKPHSPQQPLHLSRSREQLLSLWLEIKAINMSQFGTLKVYIKMSDFRHLLLPMMRSSGKQECLLQPQTHSLWLCSSQIKMCEQKERWWNLKLLLSIFLTLQYICLVLWTCKFIYSYYWQKCHENSQPFVIVLVNDGRLLSVTYKGFRLWQEILQTL